MNLIKKIILFSIILSLSACANYEMDKSKIKGEKKFYSSNGFALVYDNDLLGKGIVNRKLDNEKIVIMHSYLKFNTLVKIVNPENSLEIEAKVYRKANYPKLFNIVISKKIAQLLKLDLNNPYVEIFEVKRNKTFIAKKSNTFEEEKKVVETAPVNEVVIDILTESKTVTEKKVKKESNFIVFINDFYYLSSANKLKDELFKQTQISNLLVKKINKNKYRLLAGPFKNFDSLKSTYISLNNLGFDELNIYKE